MLDLLSVPYSHEVAVGLQQVGFVAAEVLDGGLQLIGELELEVLGIDGVKRVWSMEWLVPEGLVAVVACEERGALLDESGYLNFMMLVDFVVHQEALNLGSTGLIFFAVEPRQTMELI